MKKKVNFMMWQYKVKKFFRDKRKFIKGIGGVMFAIIGISVLIAWFSDDKETVKIASAATSILVIIELFDTIQQSR